MQPGGRGSLLHSRGATAGQHRAGPTHGVGRGHVPCFVILWMRFSIASISLRFGKTRTPARAPPSGHARAPAPKARDGAPARAVWHACARPGEHSAPPPASPLPRQRARGRPRLPHVARLAQLGCARRGRSHQHGRTHHRRGRGREQQRRCPAASTPARGRAHPGADYCPICEVSR